MTENNQSFVQKQKAPRRSGAFWAFETQTKLKQTDVSHYLRRPISQNVQKNIFSPSR